MSQRVGGTNPGTYLGVNALTPPNFRQVNRAPTTNDTKTFRLGDIWQQTNTDNFWILAKLSATMASPNVQVATWVPFAGGTFVVNTLTGNTGGAVSPTAGNINVVGDGTHVTVAGNPGTSTLTISLVGTGVVESLVGDDGIPVTPLLGAIDVLGTPLGGSSVAFTGATPHELQLNVTDSSLNTLIGRLAGNATLTASNNVSLGYNTGHALTNGTQNVFVGMSSGAHATSADNNTAVGWASLGDLVTGSNNIAVGLLAGANYTTSESSNILIGNDGVISENNTMRLGTTGVGPGEVSRTFVAGVDGVNVGNTANVVTEVGGQLGTAVITAGGGIVVTPGPNEILITASGAPAAAICSFSAYNSTTRANYFTVPGTTVITFDQTFFNIGNNYDTATNTFTAPVTGHYLFNMSVSLSPIPNTIDTFALELETTTNTYVGNNNSPTAMAAAVGPSIDVSQSFLVLMNAGDTARVNVILGAAGNCSLTGFDTDAAYRTTFSGTFVDTTGSATAGTTVAFSARVNAENNVTGDGTVFSLGAVTAMTTAQNIGGGFFPGDGAGTSASFTAPVTGTYILTYTLATQVPVGGGNVQGWSMYLNGAGFNASLGVPTRNQCTGFFGDGGFIDGSGSVVWPLTAGDIITWTFTATGGARTSSTVVGFVSGALLTTSSGANSFPTDAGTATPLAGVLDIVATATSGATVAFTGTGHTVALNVTSTPATNTLIGSGAGGTAITTAALNTALGYQALNAITSARNNIAIGNDSGLLLTTGADNTILGCQAGNNLLTGANNILVGQSAGTNYNGAESNNIVIGTSPIYPIAGDNNTIRIGRDGNAGDEQNRCFIAGIRGITTGVNDAIAVVIDSAGQLGTTSSSIRFKENVEDMGSESDAIMRLRPVKFNYKERSDLQTGLIAEEVYEIMPRLVVRNNNGDIESVKYHELPALLLNEIQKLRRELDELKANLN